MKFENVSDVSTRLFVKFTLYEPPHLLTDWSNAEVVGRRRVVDLSAAVQQAARQADLIALADGGGRHRFVLIPDGGDLQIDALRIEPLDRDVEVLLERELDDLGQAQLTNRPAGLLGAGRRRARRYAVLQRFEAGLITLERFAHERILRLGIALLGKGAGGRQHDAGENNHTSRRHIHGPVFRYRRAVALAAAFLFVLFEQLLQLLVLVGGQDPPNPKNHHRPHLAEVGAGRFHLADEVLDFRLVRRALRDHLRQLVFQVRQRALLRPETR